MSEEEAKELAEVIDVVYGTIDWTIRTGWRAVWRAQITDGVASSSPHRDGSPTAKAANRVQQVAAKAASRPTPSRRGGARSPLIRSGGNGDPARLWWQGRREDRSVVADEGGDAHREVSEETAKELAELIHVVYDTTRRRPWPTDESSRRSPCSSRYAAVVRLLRPLRASRRA